MRSWPSSSRCRVASSPPCTSSMTTRGSRGCRASTSTTGARAASSASASSSCGASETISSPSERSSGARRPRNSSRCSGSATSQTTSVEGRLVHRGEHAADALDRRRVREERDHEADRAGRARGERPRAGARPVGELVDGREHALPGGRADLALVEDAGDGADPHPRARRDVGDRGAAPGTRSGPVRGPQPRHAVKNLPTRRAPAGFSLDPQLVEQRAPQRVVLVVAGWDLTHLAPGSAAGRGR